MKQSGWNIEVKGKSGSRYVFPLGDIDPQYVKEWVEEGFLLSRTENTIPMWLPAWALRPWCFIQSVLNFRNPF